MSAERDDWITSAQSRDHRTFAGHSNHLDRPKVYGRSGAIQDPHASLAAVIEQSSQWHLDFRLTGLSVMLTADGTERRLALPAESQVGPPIWAPDGRHEQSRPAPGAWPTAEEQFRAMYPDVTVPANVWDTSARVEWR